MRKSSVINGKVVLVSADTITVKAHDGSLHTIDRMLLPKLDYKKEFARWKGISVITTVVRESKSTTDEE